MKWRPQILVAILILGIIGVTALLMNGDGIVSGVIAGVTALGMKLLENNKGG